MRLAYLILLIFFCSAVHAQDYKNMGISTHVGVGLLKDQNPLSTFDIELYKHVGLGIYSTVSFSQGQSVTPIEKSLFTGYSNNSSGFENISNYQAYGLGLSKYLRISKNAQVGLTLSGQWLKNDVFYLDSITYNEPDVINLLESKSLFSEESILSYSVSLEYLQTISKNLSLGFYTKYQGHLESLMFGVAVNTNFDFKAASISKANVLFTNNSLAVQLGYGIGDGGYNVFSYDLIYGNAITEKLSLITKLSLGNGGGRLEQARSYEIDNEIFKNRNLASKVGSNPIVKPRHIRSIGLGGKFKINTLENASLNVYAGGRYLVQTNADILIDKEDEIANSNHFLLGGNASSFTPEIGVSYTQYINQVFYVEGTLDVLVSPGTLIFGIQSGVHF